jgi:hypothetical protein
LDDDRFWECFASFSCPCRAVALQIGADLLGYVLRERLDEIAD